MKIGFRGWNNEQKDKIRERLLKKKQETVFQYSGKGKHIIILSSDCIGGMLMKDYKLPCYSPTVNNWYLAEDFLKICENPDLYFSYEVEEIGVDQNGCPMGKLGDVVIHFGHVKTFEEGAKRWKRYCRAYFSARKENNEILVIQSDRNGFTENLLERFENLPYKNKVLFTHKKYKQYPHCLYIKGSGSQGFVDIMTDYEGLFSIKKRYERFDFYQCFLDMYKS